MKIIELFSGTGSFSKVAKERGHQVFTLDFDKSFNPDLCIDILDFTIDMLPEYFRNPDVVWASPPCQKFSVMTIYRNWKKEGDKYIPKNEDAVKAIQIVDKTIQIIKLLNPKFYVIENPMGMLRKQDLMQELKRDTVTYCQYGMEYQKKTDLWNNLNHTFKPCCSPRSPCHVRAPRGSKLGVQGTNGFRENRNQKHPIDISREKRFNAAAIRAIVPRQLCEEVIIHCENNF
jgi:site-specific DNA-cytosine methylase